jgi:hypothetical protein
MPSDLDELIDVSDKVPWGRIRRQATGSLRLGEVIATVDIRRRDDRFFVRSQETGQTSELAVLDFCRFVRNLRKSGQFAVERIY